MKRLYYLAPTIDSAEQISNDLHQHGVSDWRFHILSKDEAGLYTHHLHTANALQKTDMVRFMERGLMVGLSVGLLFALPAFYIEAFTVEAWIAICVFCVLFGTWAGGIGGISQDNYKTRHFQEAIDAGNYLIMVDAKKKDQDLIKRLMAQHHPEAQLQGSSSTYTNPFASAEAKDLIKPA
ncbi:MAG: hypothetical protein R3183_01490 [Oleiphilaceae bacterium]|nr:hypothetical protein [Oleiphilaceae bacterium]